eukprot:scaffold27879_cov40-Phaeocystis_antarctica.AAC.1
MFQIFSGAGQTDTTFAPFELAQAVSESASDVLSCDLPSLARAGRVLRPHPAMLAPVQPTRHTAHCTHPLPWLRISLRSRAQSSWRASCADSKRRAGAGEAPSSRRRAPADHLRRKRACEQQGRN